MIRIVVAMAMPTDDLHRLSALNITVEKAVTFRGEEENATTENSNAAAAELLQ
jgi:hypothetical protein